ncbi:hypothetical protein [Streptacidiphilus neutrinimicus]|uniref:hypothetical protein n=1 Tax=Streptacidiphilus neutrinimicus TaxID=105420 RepID=UPI0005AB54FA|nr:hypothetical protein [Streptacidiphilus neutrinimicus]
MSCGVPAVADAFARGNVPTLLLHAARGADPAKWGTRSDPELTGSSPEALGEHGAAAFQAPASALLLRAAALTDAAFSELLPSAPADDGCAAVLRYTG